MKSNFKKKIIKDFTLLATKKIKITTDVKMVGLTLVHPSTFNWNKNTRQPNYKKHRQKTHTKQQQTDKENLCAVF